MGVIVVREQSLTRPWGEGELTAYIFTRYDGQLIRQYLHNRRLGFRRLHVDTVTSDGGIDAFLTYITNKENDFFKINVFIFCFI